MIDFRYHLVSLVAVFMALAVGIALGAGPLREGLASTLEAEVAQLREERADLRAQVDDATRRAEVKDEAVEVLGAGVLPGTLDDVRVAVVVLPGADRNVLDALENRFELAGAQVVLVAEIDTRSGDPDPPTERVELLERLARTLDVPAATGDEGPSGAAVLAAALSGADAPGFVGAWLDAASALENEGLIDLSWREPTAVEVTERRAPDAIVLASGGLTVEASEGETGAERLGLRLELVRALAQLDTPTVVTGAGAEVLGEAGLDPVDPVVTAVREDDELAERVSTVDNLESVAGQVATVMATGWELEQESGHYGVGDLAQAALPLVPPLRTTGGVVPGLGGSTPTEPVPDDATATTTAP